MIIKILLAILLSSLLSSPAFATNWVGEANMAGAWLMDDASGGAVDATSNSLDLDDGATLTYSETGVFDDAIAFSSDWLETSGNSGISGAGDISYGGWVLTATNDGTNDHIFNIGTASTNRMSHMILNSASIKFGAWGFDTISSTDINGVVFVHCVVIYGGSNYKLYIDGNLDTTSGAYSSLNIADDDLDIGRYTGGAFYFTGTLDELFIYQAEMDSTDVNDVMDNGLSQAAAGVIKTYNGLAWASVKTINGVAVGSIKTINGAAAQ